MSLDREAESILAVSGVWAYTKLGLNRSQTVLEYVVQQGQAPVRLQPDNHNKKYETLFVEIDTGQIKLPRFQRDFVWDKEQSARLIDSILKGFPIGTFIFWKTKDELRSYRDIGNHKLPSTPPGDYAQYILDGQQRITSLYAIRKGIRLNKDGMKIDYRDIFIDLDSNPETDEQIVVTDRIADRAYVSVHEVLSKPITSFIAEFGIERVSLIEYYKTKLTTYDFSSITICDYPIEIACEVFARINTSGKALTAFEIMVAKTYSEARDFDLAEQFEILRDGSDDDDACLAGAKFETVPAAVVMQCVAAITIGQVRSRDILRIPRDVFIDSWKPATDALFMAIDFLRSELRVPVSQLLPYPAILVPLSYYFHQTKNRKADHQAVRQLEQFFYWVGLTERYGSGSEAKLVEDLKRMEKITKGELPEYPATELKVDPLEIEGTWFSTSRAYCKTILCLLAFKQPKTFDTNGLVILDNSHLKIASSRNYHHFFPRKYIETYEKDSDANLIANITLIDGYSNKHRIGKKAPSKYIGAFAKKNSHMSETLKTHLIDDQDAFGVTTDDYAAFIEARSRAIAGALNRKLSPKL